MKQLRLGRLIPPKPRVPDPGVLAGFGRPLPSVVIAVLAVMAELAASQREQRPWARPSEGENPRSGGGKPGMSEITAVTAITGFGGRPPAAAGLLGRCTAPARARKRDKPGESRNCRKTRRLQTEGRGQA